MSSERITAPRALAAGLSATLLTILLVHTGLLPFDTVGGLAAALGHRTLAGPDTGVWWVSLLLHVAGGGVLCPVVYLWILEPMVTGSRLQKGLKAGGLFWLGSLLVARPAGWGAGAAAQAISGLVIWLFYGVLLSHAGSVYGRPRPAAPPSRVRAQRRGVREAAVTAGGR